MQPIPESVLLARVDSETVRLARLPSQDTRQKNDKLAWGAFVWFGGFIVIAAMMIMYLYTIRAVRFADAGLQECPIVTKALFGTEDLGFVWQKDCLDQLKVRDALNHS